MKPWSQFVIGMLVAVALCRAPVQTSIARGSASASAWPMFQHDLQHTGRSTFEGILTRPILKWHQRLPGVCGEVAVGLSLAADGTMYVAACDRMSAVRPADGTILWTFVGNNFSRSVPTVSPDNRVYWGFADTLAAISPEGTQVGGWTNFSGDVVWASSPAITDDGSIYVEKNILFALSTAGAVKWMFSFGHWGGSSPAVGSDGTIYVSNGGGGLAALDPGGNLKWWREVSTYDSSPSIGADGTIYIGTTNAGLRAYDPDGTLRWAFSTDESAGFDATVAIPPAIGQDGTIYIATHVPGFVAEQVHVYAVNPDGTQKWKYPIPRSPNSNPGVVAPLTIDRSGHVYACADNGSCYAFSPTGDLLWELPIEPGEWIRTAPFFPTDGQLVVMIFQDLYSFVASTDVLFLPSVFAAYTDDEPASTASDLRVDSGVRLTGSQQPDP